MTQPGDIRTFLLPIPFDEAIGEVPSWISVGDLEGRITQHDDSDLVVVVASPCVSRAAKLSYVAVPLGIAELEDEAGYAFSLDFPDLWQRLSAMGLKGIPVEVLTITSVDLSQVVFLGTELEPDRLGSVRIHSPAEDGEQKMPLVKVFLSPVGGETLGSKRIGSTIAGLMIAGLLTTSAILATLYLLFTALALGWVAWFDRGMALLSVAFLITGILYVAQTHPSELAELSFAVQLFELAVFSPFFEIRRIIQTGSI